MPQLSAELNSTQIVEVEETLTSLANEDAIKIFLAARAGIEKSTEAIKELKLTQKRYYTRLKGLLEAGLVEKRNNVYQHTSMGNICYALGKSFIEALNHRDHLELVDKLKKSKSISPQETRRILEAISRKGLLASLEVGNILDAVKPLEEYEAFIKETTSLIEEAEEEVLLASYHFDPRIIEGILRASQRGLTISFLSGGTESLDERLQMLRMILNPQTVKLYFALLGENMLIKQAELPYGFCVVDKKSVIIELPDPLTDTFSMGFSLQNQDLGLKLAEAFKDLYGAGREHSLLNQIKRNLDKEVTM